LNQYVTISKRSSFFNVNLPKIAATPYKYRFGYGRKWTLEKMRETVLVLPTTSDGKPDWEFMENYIKSLPYSDRI